MEKQFLAIAVSSSVLLGLGIGFIIGINKDNCNHDVTCNPVNHQLKDTYDITKGGVYVKDFYKNSNNPFTEVIRDTITILQIQSSKRNDEVYVKWTYNKWKDTTKFISSELLYLSKDIKRIK